VSIQPRSVEMRCLTSPPTLSVLTEGVARLVVGQAVCGDSYQVALMTEEGEQTPCGVMPRDLGQQLLLHAVEPGPVLLNNEQRIDPLGLRHRSEVCRGQIRQADQSRAHHRTLIHDVIAQEIRHTKYTESRSLTCVRR
jgi:hypothetical protein